MNAPVGTPRAAGALRELTLVRLRLFFREPGAVFWTFGFPLVMSVALGIAFRNRPPEPVRVAVVLEKDANPFPFDVPAALRAPAFQTSLYLSPLQAQDALRTGKVDVVVLADGSAPISYRFDPTRPESRLGRALTDDALQRAAGRRDAVRSADQAVTAPGSRYIDFLIPGLIGMNIMSSGMWGLAWVIVEMRTRKLLKRMVATPMSRPAFLGSFVAMRLLFLLFELPVLLGFGWLVFKVPLVGSLPLLVGVAALGALAFSGLGLLVASRAQNTQTASGLINLVMLPMFVASGVFFSTSRFPEAVQPVLRLLPLTALNDAMRAVMLEGAGPAAIAGPLLLLAAVTVVTFTLALRLFRWR